MSISAVRCLRRPFFLRRRSVERFALIAARCGIGIALAAAAVPAFAESPAPVFPRPAIEVTLGNDMTDEEGPSFREVGATSVESYVTWQSVEDAGQGRWNWAAWDAQVALLKKHGLRWVPFLIAGCAYATPKWFREGEPHVGAACLEHGIASKIESIWNPAMPEQVDRFIGEFARRYRDSGVIESVLLGVSGDFGESIYPVWGGGWTFQIPGRYHTHPGYWSGDPHARAAFRKAMAAKYGSLEALNAAWGSAFASVDAIEMPPLSNIVPPDKKRPTPEGQFIARTPQDRRRWLDFTEWYRGGMTDWTDRWMGIARKHFPETEIYLCTGGDARTSHGSDFSAQCKLAAKHKGGVRITNESSDYAQNFYLTHWVASAGKHYGAYFGFESAGTVDEFGNVARIYNVAASGAAQLHAYKDCVFGEEERVYQAHRKHLRPGKPQVSPAVWYPKASLALDQCPEVEGSEWREFQPRIARLRDAVDCDFVDEAMLRDGALRRYPVLAIVAGRYIEKEDLARIRAWVEEGGLLIAGDFGGMRTVEGDDGPWLQLVKAEGGARQVGRGRTVQARGEGVVGEAFVRAVTDALSQAGAPVADGAVDGVFATVLEGRAVYLNTTEGAVEKTLRVRGREPIRVAVPPRTIHEVRLPQ